MKLILRVDGTLEAHLEPKTIKDAFRAIGEVREFLMAEPCGCCGSGNTWAQLRNTKGYSFYEWKCGKCGAQFAFHQDKPPGEGLYPSKRTGTTRGWSVWGQGERPSSEQNQEPEREPQDYPQEEPIPF